jgi:hypothetical protein
VKTSTWDIVAWNRAAASVLCDYAALAAEQRNSLRLAFCNPRIRAAMPNWESDARFVVAAFRADTARTGATTNVKAMVDELSRLSPEFDAMWRDNDVRNTYGETAKHIRHPGADRAGIFGLCGRWPARFRHGDLQSGNAGGRRAHQIARQTANVYIEGRRKTQEDAAKRIFRRVGLTPRSPVPSLPPAPPRR